MLSSNICFWCAAFAISIYYLCTLRALATSALLVWIPAPAPASVQPVVSGACSDQSDQSCRPDTCSTAALQHPAPTSPGPHRGKRKLDLRPPHLSSPYLTLPYLLHYTATHNAGVSPGQLSSSYTGTNPGRTKMAASMTMNASLCICHPYNP